MSLKPHVEGSVYRQFHAKDGLGLTMGQKLAVWGVHGLTMSGVIWACLAMISLAHGELKAMWAWLGVAILVDGVDGTLARRYDVKNRAPWFDGTTLDMIVDFITWTLIPALFMYLHLPLGPKPLAMAMMILVCISSVFCYCNTGMKASDNYFVGFPAAWNAVAVYLWLMGTGAVVNIALTVTFAVLTLAPVAFVHPFRVRHLMVVNLLAVGLWFFALVWLVASYPDGPLPVWIVLWAASLWLAGIGVWRTFAGARES
ncbi:MAG: phosphatidylcholine synthase [Bowdeniella nasicola]|nr:phosphatidylcholine synthase [Bowdeniella nasicola]